MELGQGKVENVVQQEETRFRYSIKRLERNIESISGKQDKLLKEDSLMINLSSIIFPEDEKTKEHLIHLRNI